MMTFDERQARIKFLLEENKGVLSTPLMSEGNISPYQVGLMSERQRKKWQSDAQKKMEIESEIRSLKRSDEEISKREEEQRIKDAKGRIEQINNLTEIMSRFTGKKGKILPKYAREILKLNTEKEEIIKQI